ncbi:MAG: (4Fe-4S)-binding protein [Calditrichaeota bacterium]|nr:4Fe-4S binding protein [Calditrichota bacterium]RQW04927.1 MAG: (4Fe-4S)-binding protein [Calditrichota bacterium]
MPHNNSKYRQIVIVSGKGGTGKTTLAAALCELFENRVVSDTDVDAADLHILLKPEILERHEYSGGNKAVINRELCTGCDLCEEYCRFDAIHDYQVDPLACEGCGFCVRLCPENAISFPKAISGFFQESAIKNGEFVDAELLPGSGNSGKLVSEVKKSAAALASQNQRAWLIVDGPPGIGCPVNASLTGTDLAVIVTEPTVSGLHDLSRLIELTQRFRIPSAIVINKSDLNPENTKNIQKFAESENIPFLGIIPYDDVVLKALISEKSVINFPDSSAAVHICQVYKNILELLENQK